MDVVPQQFGNQMGNLIPLQGQPWENLEEGLEHMNHHSNPAALPSISFTYTYALGQASSGGKFPNEN